MIRQYSNDIYFKFGLLAMQHDVSSAMGIQIRIQALYFPDMLSLLAWSVNPVLAADGIVLIAGSERVISVLKGIVDPRYVILSESGESLTSIKEKIYSRIRNNHENQSKKDEIRITRREMVYMWAYIHGSPIQSGSKKDSAIRRAVMNKVGAVGIISLLIRFRLLFHLDNYFLLKYVRMRNSKVTVHRLKNRWLYLQELRETVSNVVPVNNFKNDKR